MSKRKRRRWLVWVVGVLLFVFVGLSGFVLWRLSNFFGRDRGDSEFVSQRFASNERPELLRYPALGLTVRAIQGGLQAGPRVLFVHGSPGSWRDYSGYFSDAELRSRAQLVSFDRPGFGETGGAPEPSLKLQAQVAAPLLETPSSDPPTIVLGYSLGGPVAAELAADYSRAVDGLVLVAPSLDPELEELHWYNWLAALPGFNFLLPEALTHSNREIFPLKKELLELRKKLSRITVPTVVVQGLADGLVPPANADFVARMLPQSRIVRVPGIGHGILWQSRSLIVQEILQMLEQVAAVPRTLPASAKGASGAEE